MKKISIYLCFIAAFVMLFASCSKDENPATSSDKATLSFGAIVNDLASKATTKQSSVGDLPECSDAAPAFVEIVLSEGGVPVVGTSQNPFRVNLVAGQVFTQEVAELELDPGTYSLDHFMVYDASGNLIWIAPKGGELAQFVDNPLPLSINLGAGVKKYVDVSVLCFDDREVNEYGYLFFDIDTNEVIEFCLFGNYCDPSGRHYPARFSVDVWLWENDQMGAQIHNNVTNTVTPNQYGDYAGTPVCIPLPDRDGDDNYYFEVTLLSSDAYGSVQEKVIRSGVVSEAEVKGLFDGEDNLDYYHFREGEGCENDDTPPVLEEPGDDAERYKACLTPLNDSGAFAFGYFRLDGNMLQTTVFATGVRPGEEHPQHIHGKDGENAVCPPESAAGPDGLLTLAEGIPFYGGVKLALDYEDGTFPVATTLGQYTYNRTFTLGEGGTISAADFGPLEDRVVVVHGLQNAGDYDPSLPVACAEITEQE